MNDGSNLLAIGDHWLLGESHLYTKRPIDPEGVISTISAIAHTLIGFHCGKLIIKNHKNEEKVLQLLLFGFVITAIGLLFTFALPLNKRIWSPTFALVTCGFAASLLAWFMYIIDIRNKRTGCNFFLIYGVNPLFLYVMSEVLAIVFDEFGIKEVICIGINGILGKGCIASATYAVGFMLLHGAMGYYLWKKKIYIKI
jgi:predicted acyltransferase